MEGDDAVGARRGCLLAPQRDVGVGAEVEVAGAVVEEEAAAEEAVEQAEGTTGGDEGRAGGGIGED